MGKKRYKVAIHRALASFAEQDTLSNGLDVDRPYRSNLYVDDYTKGTAATAQDLTATSEKLTINNAKTILMYIDDIDKVQNKWDASKKWGEEAGRRMAEIEDAYFLYEVVNANNVVDAEDLGGSSGTPATITASNIDKIFSAINKLLDDQNVPEEERNRFLAISPSIKRVLWERIAGKESMLGDKTAEAGNIGRYAGLELFLTNNLTCSAVWTPANDPGNTQTITIQGVTFTFVSSIGSTAGNVLISGTVAGTLDNLVALINAPGTTTAQGVAFTGENLAKVKNMVAVDGTTYLLVYHKGGSYMTVTTSDAADAWSLKTQHMLAGVKGAIDMVVQKEPSLGEKDMASTISAGKRGMNIMPLDLFGIKTFNQGKNEIVNVKVDSSVAGF